MLLLSYMPPSLPISLCLLFCDDAHSDPGGFSCSRVVWKPAGLLLSLCCCLDFNYFRPWLTGRQVNKAETPCFTASLLPPGRANLTLCFTFQLCGSPGSCYHINQVLSWRSRGRWWYWEATECLESEQAQLVFKAIYAEWEMDTKTVVLCTLWSADLISTC